MFGVMLQMRPKSHMEFISTQTMQYDESQWSIVFGIV